jgi:ribosomal protein S26
MGEDENIKNQNDNILNTSNKGRKRKNKGKTKSKSQSAKPKTLEKTQSSIFITSAEKMIQNVLMEELKQQKQTSETDFSSIPPSVKKCYELPLSCSPLHIVRMRVSKKKKNQG